MADPGGKRACLSLLKGIADFGHTDWSSLRDWEQQFRLTGVVQQLD